MQTPDKPHVILIKEALGTADTDPYAVALSKLYNASFVPALSHVLVNVDKLSSLIASGNDGRYAGIIFTSQRAVEAWTAAADSADGSIESSSWTTTPHYAVGPATAAALSGLPGHVRPPSYLIRGTDSGNAENLAALIVEQGTASQSLPYLYLVGDKRRETISSVLFSNGLKISELHVYTTAPAEAFDTAFKEVVQQSRGKRIEWLVFFSPSGVKLALPLAKSLGLEPRLAAIGPTTRAYLENEARVTVDAMADKPDAEALLQALRAHP